MAVVVFLVVFNLGLGLVAPAVLLRTAFFFGVVLRACGLADFFLEAFFTGRLEGVELFELFFDLAFFLAGIGEVYHWYIASGQTCVVHVSGETIAVVSANSRNARQERDGGVTEKMVDLVGIEPTTSSMPWKRAPSCATGPHDRMVLVNSHAAAWLSQTT